MQVNALDPSLALRMTGPTITMIAFKRYKSDWYVTFGIIFVIFMIYGTMIHQFHSRLREEALMSELKSLRLAVVTFHYLYQRNPRDMRELEESVFKTKGGKDRPLVPTRLRERGLKDPFGNVYYYDSATGWVDTTTEEYKGW